MKPAPFTYHRPSTLAEAAEMLAASGSGSGSGKVLAGGQSLIPLMSMRLATPTALVDINHVSGLGEIEVGTDAVRVGALARHAALESHEPAYDANPLLRRALLQVAHGTIRNRGTTVGSIVHADPAGEMPAVLRLLGGSVEAVSQSRGRRRIDAADFFVGPLESALADDEIAVSAVFPRPPAGAGSWWLEIARRRGDYALVGVGALVTLDADHRLTDAAVCLISVGGTPVYADVGAAARGSAYDEVDWADALALVDAAIDPETDIHATTDYRRHLARVLTGRALAEATADARTRTVAA